MEQLLETTAELAHEGNTLRSGMPKPLRLALFVERFRREVRAPFPPAWMVARDDGAARRARPLPRPRCALRLRRLIASRWTSMVAMRALIATLAAAALIAPPAAWRRRCSTDQAILRALAPRGGAPLELQRPHHPHRPRRRHARAPLVRGEALPRLLAARSSSARRRAPTAACTCASRGRAGAHWIDCGYEVQINDNPAGDPRKTGSIYGFADLDGAGARIAPANRWTRLDDPGRRPDLQRLPRRQAHQPLRRVAPPRSATSACRPTAALRTSSRSAAIRDPRALSLPLDRIARRRDLGAELAQHATRAPRAGPRRS